LVRGGGPRPSLQVLPVSVAEIFCPRGRIASGRPVPASAMEPLEALSVNV
jgi:hypothetical protein